MKKALLILLFMGVSSLSVINAQNDNTMGPPPGGNPPPGQNGRPMGPPPGGGKGGRGPGGGGFSAAKGVRSYSEDAVLSGKTVISDSTDMSAVLVTGGTLTMTGCTLTSSADASSTDAASFYGVNAVACAQPKGSEKKKNKSVARLNSTNNHISGSGRGTNGLFAYGNGEVNTNHDIIIQTGGNARGMICSGGGTINVTADTVVTRGHSSSCVATDRGGGTITINGGTYTCYGPNSAGIYSTGEINATDATFISHGGEALVIEGTNFINLTNCNVTACKDKWGVLLYQSFSGDAEEGERATLSMRGGSLTYEGKATGLFYNTNNRDSLYLEDVKIVNSSDTLINCKRGGWGNRDMARAGGRLAVKTKRQKLEGIIAADKDSEVKIALSDGSIWEGAFNSSNNAKRAEISIDTSSCWSVTADSYVNGTLTAEVGSIQSNGHNVYYSADINPRLNGTTLTLQGGGKLIPM